MTTAANARPTSDSPRGSTRSPGGTPFALVSCDFVKTGGMDRANYALASYLARAGHEVHAVAHSASADLLAERSVTFHRVPKPLGSYFLGEKVLARRGLGVASEVSRRGGRTLVNGGNCPWGDANWVHYVHAAYAPRVAAGAVRRLKYRLAHRAFLAGERRALSRARIVFANSRRTKQDLVEHLNLPEERIRTIYYGTDPALFRPAAPGQRAEVRRRLGWDAGRPVAAFVGALGDRRKGFDVVLSAWEELSRDRAWDVDLAVVGRGAEAPAWRARVAQTGLASRVHFLGFRRDVPDVLKACDALVSPTRYEAYGLGVHEALCCGLPALVSASAGVAERYPHELAELLVADPERPAELAERLAAWRQKLEHYRTAIEPFSASLRAYTWDDMAEQMLQALSEPVVPPGGRT